MHPGADGQLYFRVLGPVSVERDGVRLDLGGPQRRLVLALLLSRANEVAAVDCLIDALWGDHPPPSHRVQLHGRISDLRRRLAPAAARTAAPIVTHHTGYLLAVPPDHYDLERFRVGVETARRHRSAGDDADAIQLFRSALSLWRAPAFADASSPEIDRVAGWAEELRVSA